MEYLGLGVMVARTMALSILPFVCSFIHSSVKYVVTQM